MKSSKAFQKVDGVPNLYHRGERYYARLSIGGKQTWRSLETTKIRTAKQRLAKLQTGQTTEVKKREEPALLDALASTLEFRRTRRGISRPLSPETVRYHQELLKIAKRLFQNRKMSSFSDSALMDAIAGCGLSQSRRKAVFELVKGTYKRACEQGQIAINPLSGHVPDQVPRKERVLPSREQLEEIVEELEREFPEVGRAAGLTTRFLAFSGLRWSEARGVKWEHVSKDSLRVEGLNGRVKTARAKRDIQINPPLKEALKDIAKIYGKNGRVMPMASVRTYLARACENLGIEKVGHHDLRSWFCTWCLASGIDVNTVADWLGDDPNVVLRTYAQMQQGHKREAASKLR